MDTMGRRGRRRFHVGTSGWAYDDWAGRFYPEGIEDRERLRFYAEHFDSVEVNVTFYRLPFEGMIKGWNRRLPSSFHLVVKGPRAVTHIKRLKDCRDPLQRFLERVLDLRTLEVILWQLPPSLHKDIPRLDRFLGWLPGEVRHAVEFRHQSWWDEETVEVLARHDVAFVAVSHPELPDELLAPTDLLYLRFHGLGERLYEYDYSRRELSEWARRVSRIRRGKELYAFFNNDWYANAPRNAKTFESLLSSVRMPD